MNKLELHQAALAPVLQGSSTVPLAGHDDDKEEVDILRGILKHMQTPK